MALCHVNGGVAFKLFNFLCGLRTSDSDTAGCGHVQVLAHQEN